MAKRKIADAFIGGVCLWVRLLGQRRVQTPTSCPGEISCLAWMDVGCPMRYPRWHDQLIWAGHLLAWQRLARTAEGALREWVSSEPFHREPQRAMIKSGACLCSSLHVIQFLSQFCQAGTLLLIPEVERGLWRVRWQLEVPLNTAPCLGCSGPSVLGNWMTSPFAVGGAPPILLPMKAPLQTLQGQRELSLGDSS